MWKRLFRQALPHLSLPTEPGLYLIYELAEKHDYQNQQLTIYNSTLRVKTAMSILVKIVDSRLEYSNETFSFRKQYSHTNLFVHNY